MQIEIVESIGSWLRERLITEHPHEELDFTIGHEDYNAAHARESSIDEEVEVSALFDSL